MQNPAMFEVPASHEATNYINPYTNPEWEGEWETPVASAYTNPEWEMSNPYTNPESEYEWEMSNPYANPEWEDEGEYFLGGAWKGLKRFGRGALNAAAKAAAKAAPGIVGTLASAIPGGAVFAGPAAKLTKKLLSEAEMEVAQIEAEFFGTNEAEAEVANTQMAHEAALAEFLAAQAAEAPTLAEAEAALGAALPLTVKAMGGSNALRHIIPHLAQANFILAMGLKEKDPNLARLGPHIHRLTMKILEQLARSGQPINGATAVKAMAAATSKTLNNPPTVQTAIIRNHNIRQSTARPSNLPSRRTNGARRMMAARP